MRRSMLVAVLALAVSVANARTARQDDRDENRPKLLVLIVVDQMRADYVTRFRDDWTAGLKRLLSEGAYFARARFPYLTTVTCPGHATVATGTFPHRHGVFQNAWYDRQAQRTVSCTEDAQLTAIRYSGSTGGGSSARTLLVPTLADELRTRRGQVVTLSMKARSAIMLAGHGGEAVTWLNDSLDGWATSSAYSSQPVPAVKAFLDANPVDADYGKTWTRLLPSARYRTPDDATGEAPPKGWTRAFPHALDGRGSADREFRVRWQGSPFGDAYLGRMAAALVESMELGTNDATDFLGVGFSSPDIVGHAFGPNSQEVQDVFAHLDRTLGVLLGRLDSLVGREAYVVALTSDHGVGVVTEQLQQAGRPGGRLSSDRLAEVAERAAQTAAGPGRYVRSVNGNDVYFDPLLYKRLGNTPEALNAIVTALEGQAGIMRVFRREQLVGQYEARDPVLKAAMLSYVSGRSGDMVLAPRPGWVVSDSTAAANHGTANPYDQEVPVILMGRGITPGVYHEAVTPADIAPTLAALAGVTLPRAEGQVLRSALTPPVSVPARR